MIKEIIAALDIVNQFLPTILGSVSSSYINFENVYKILVFAFAYLCYMKQTSLFPSVTLQIITANSSYNCISCF